MMSPDNCAKNLKIIRAKWGLGLVEFADIIESSSTRVSAFEKGKLFPKLHSILLLSIKTGITVNDLCLREVETSEIPSSPKSDIKLYRNDIKLSMVREDSGKLLIIQTRLIDAQDEIIRLKDENAKLTKELRALKKP